MDYKTKIALVDDDSFCLNYYTQVFNELGFEEVNLFESGDELLLTKEFRPDMIFLDFCIEGTSGVELVKKLHETYPNVQIVILSGQNNMVETINLMNCGIFDYIIKGENDNVKILEVMQQYLSAKKFIGSFSDLDLTKKESKRVKMISAVQNKIRKEISDELHDNVNQLLGASKLYLETAKNDCHNRLDLLNESKSILETAIFEIRKISHDLVYGEVNKDVFSRSLATLLDFLEKQDKFIVSHNLNPALLDRCLSTDQKHNLIRILQETVNNTIKYAEATHFSIVSTINKDNFQLIIKDNGKGFDHLNNEPGIGLNNIYSRVTSINGTVNLHTSIGKGCRWKINLPLQAS